MKHEAAAPEHIVCGFHAVQARLRADSAAVLELYVDAARNDGRLRTLVASAQGAGVRVLTVPAARLDGLTGGARHQGVVARVSVRAGALDLDTLLESLSGPALLLLLDGVTDPQNLGACLRSANAAGAQAVIAPRDRAVGMTPVVSKVASGAAEDTPYLMVTNLARAIETIQAHNVWVIGADETAPQDLYQADLPTSIAWVLGAEGGGLRRLTRERCDFLVRIPMRGSVQSLNVSVAAGVALYESVRRQGLSAP